MKNSSPRRLRDFWITLYVFWVPVLGLSPLAYADVPIAIQGSRDFALTRNSFLLSVAREYEISIPSGAAQELQYRHHHAVEGVPFERFTAYYLVDAQLIAIAGYVVPNRKAYESILQGEVRSRKKSMPSVETVVEETGPNSSAIRSLGEEIQTFPNGKGSLRLRRRDFFFTYERGIVVFSGKKRNIDMRSLATAVHKARQGGVSYYFACNFKKIAANERESLFNQLYRLARFRLQRHDDEPAATHRIRKLLGENSLNLIETVFRGLDEFTFSFGLPGVDHQALTCHCEVSAKKGSDLERLIRGLRHRNIVTQRDIRHSEAVLAGGLSLSIPKDIQDLLLLLTDPNNPQVPDLMFNGLLRELARRKSVEGQFSLTAGELVAMVKTDSNAKLIHEFGPFPNNFELSKGVLPFPQIWSVDLLPGFFVHTGHSDGELWMDVNRAKVSRNDSSETVMRQSEKGVLGSLSVDLRKWSKAKDGSPESTILRGIQNGLTAYFKAKLSEHRRILGQLELEQKKPNKRRFFSNRVFTEGSFQADFRLKLRGSKLIWHAEVGSDILRWIYATAMLARLQAEAELR